MTIKNNKSGTTLTVALSGRLDVISTSQLENSLNETLEGISSLIFDFEELKYISSSGLRILLTAQNRMKNQGTMKIIHVNENIMEIFNITGFANFMTIE